jgi:hypothetical protein
MRIKIITLLLLLAATPVFADILLYEPMDGPPGSNWNAHIVGGSMSVNSSQSYSGGASWRYVCPGSAERSEHTLRAPGLVYFDLNTEYWIAFRLYVPSSVTLHGSLLSQFHGRPDTPICGTCPGCCDEYRNAMWAFKPTSTYTQIRTRTQTDRCSYSSNGCSRVYDDRGESSGLGDIINYSDPGDLVQYDQWNLIVYNFKFDYRAGNNPFFKTWVNGNLVHDDDGLNAFYDDNGAYFKIGIYVTSQNMIAYYDDLRIGDGYSSYSEVTGGDVTGPVRSNGSPTGTLDASTTQTSISLDTDQTATCKWDTDGGEAYADMANTFSSTNSTSHSHTVSGLTPENTYVYYVRCDGAATNTTDYIISFQVDEAPSGGGQTNLINAITHTADSDNFNEALPASSLYDGVTDFDAGGSGSAGNSGIDSFWIEVTLGTMYTFPVPGAGESTVRIFGDNQGTWTSTLWTAQYKENIEDGWTAAFTGRWRYFRRRHYELL